MDLRRGGQYAPESTQTCAYAADDEADDRRQRQFQQGKTEFSSPFFCLRIKRPLFCPDPSFSIIHFCHLPEKKFFGINAGIFTEIPALLRNLCDCILAYITYYTKKRYVNKGFLCVINNCFTFSPDYAILSEDCSASVAVNGNGAHSGEQS